MLMPRSTTCYHCGLPVPAGVDLSIAIDGVAQPLCCNGCLAVAQAIVGNGLGDYYRHRDAMPNSPREALPAVLRDAQIYDHPATQKSFVREIGEHEREAALILEGITCAACVWLNESHLARLAGVTAVSVNYATHRALVRWDDTRIKLSQILDAVAAIGYRAHPYDADAQETLARKERRAALWRVFVAGFGMMQVMMYAIPAYIATEGTMTADIAQLMRWASLVLTLPVMFYSAAPFFRNAWRDLRARRIGMDVPVALGVGAAFLASLWATLSGSGEVYFDSITMFVFLLLGGRYLEMMARQHAARNVEGLARAAPAVAERLSLYPALDVEIVPAADLRAGDVVLVRPGNAVPADGSVIAGESHADEALLTGESVPVPKRIGSELTGGSMNIDSPLTMRVERSGDATRLAAIRRLVDQASMEKPRMAQLADRIAARFLSALLMLACVTATVWYFVDPSRALWVFVSVLVVSCPCALSLATPAAFAVAMGTLSRRGLLVARSDAIEALAQATHIMFDKTGTLTQGELHVVRVVAAAGADEARLRRMAAALEYGSTHPVARALRDGVDAGDIVIEQLRTQVGGGIEASVDGDIVRLGTPEFAGVLHGCAIPAAIALWQQEGGIVVTMASAKGWIGFFHLGDAVRDSAATAIADVHRLGLHAGVLSGDSVPAVDKVAGELGIDSARGRLSPEAKRDAIRELQQQGATVAMVGDGVNDAPVLAQAQVSIAMGSGTDLARARADMVLLGESLAPIAGGIEICRRTHAIVRQNLIWAFAYNLTAIPLAMTGWVTPWMAGIGMSASSLLVVLNALRLQRA